MADSADIVVLGPAWTGDAARSWTDAVAVRRGVIVALGSERAKELTGSPTRVVDARRGMVLPGFQDAHVHAPQAGRMMLGVWLHDLTGRHAYLEHISAYVADHPAGPSHALAPGAPRDDSPSVDRSHPADPAHSDRQWVIGGGWAMEAFPGGTPHRRDLDLICPERPVFLFNRDVHGAWLNSRALELAGITRDTLDPIDGRYERDPDGEPTGMLHEGAAYSYQDRWLPEVSHQDWKAGTLRGQQHLHSLGITGWQDAWVTPANLAAYRSLAQSGALTARVRGALWWDRHRGLEQIDDLLGQREAGAVGPSGSFHPTSVKIMVDGVLENFTGALLEPYCDGCGGHTDNRGLSYLDHESLGAAVKALDRHGFQVHMHAIGDRAVRSALDAVERAVVAHGRLGNRHHIAHLQVVHPQDLPRFAALGVTATCQAYWAQMEPQMAELTIPYLGDERAGWQYPFGDLWRAGTTLAMGSDWAVTTANPLEQIEVAVTRVDPENRDNAPFLPHQALPLPVALAGFTAGSAHVNGDDGGDPGADDSGGGAGGGRIELGRRADLAVLDRNLFAHPAAEIADAHVTLTIARGQAVYDPES